MLFARFVLIILFGVFFTFAIISDGRKEKFSEWLNNPNFAINKTQRTDLEEWINETLVDTDIVDSYQINPTQFVDDLKIITFDGEIPGVLSAGYMNAAYDPSLDAIFVDTHLLKYIDSDLFMFIFLHEIGHRKKEHKGNTRYFDGSWNIKSVFYPSKQDEIEADEFAIESMIEIFFLDGVEFDILLSRINSFIEESILGDFLVSNTVGIDSTTPTHPTLIERSKHLLKVLLQQASSSEELVAEQKAYQAWIDSVIRNTRANLVGEIVAPEDTFFAGGISTPWGAGFLLSDGRIAILKTDDVKTTIDPIDRQITAPTIVGAAFEGLLAAKLTSASSFWFDNGGFYLLLPSDSQFSLFFSDGRPDSRWSLVQVIEDLELAALETRHDPFVTECPTLVVSALGSFQIYTFTRVNGSYKFTKRVDIPWSSSTEEKSFIYRYHGADQHSIYFRLEYHDEEDQTSGPFYRTHVNCKSDDEWQIHMIKDIHNAITKISKIVPSNEKDGSIYIVPYDEERRSIKIFKILDKKIIEKHEFPTYIYNILDLPYISEFGGSAIKDIYLLNDQSTFIMNVVDLGFFVYNKTSREIIIRGGASRNTFVMTPVGETAIVATAAAEGARILLWRTQRIRNGD